MEEELIAQRKLAIMQLRKGKTGSEVASLLERHKNWVCKWHRRVKKEGWQGLRSRSRAPKKHGRKLASKVREAIIEARLELEAGAAMGEGLKYIGGLAVRTRLNAKKVTPLPSVPTIERVLSQAGLTKPRPKVSQEEISYPHLRPTEPHQLCQVDIVPHFLKGGQRVACFNGLDVVSRYGTGQPFTRRRSQDAAAFLCHLWQTVGIARYTQLDNEGCFNGGMSHPHVLGSVVRLALTVGTELVFSPVDHPKSNGFVERFHQDYNRHVWQDTYLADLDQVQQQSDRFFHLYRQREDHSQLAEQSPHTCHHRIKPKLLATDFAMNSQKLPLREGRIHFMRRVQAEGTVRVLNVDWAVPDPDPSHGVWVTIHFRPAGRALLSIYDAAPDVADRKCLVSHAFPLKEAVLPREERLDETAIHLVTELSIPTSSLVQPEVAERQVLFPKPRPGIGQGLLNSAIYHTTRLTQRIWHTMY
jgi:transposase InsO family protein